MKELKQELQDNQFEQFQLERLRTNALKEFKMTEAEVQMPRRVRTAWHSHYRNKVFSEPSYLDQIREESQASRPTEEKSDKEPQFEEVKRELDHLTEISELSNQLRYRQKSEQDKGGDASYLHSSSIDYAISARPRKSFRDLNDI